MERSRQLYQPGSLVQNLKKIAYQWINQCKQGGWDGLKTRMGKTGPKPRLSPEQEQQLKMLLEIQTPSQDYAFYFSAEVDVDANNDALFVKYQNQHSAFINHQKNWIKKFNG